MNPRSLILLALAVLVPASALAVLGFVLLGQQREMVRLRQQDQDLLAARILADSLAERLDRAAAEATAALGARPHRLYPTEDSLLYLGRTDAGRFEPPYPRPTRSSLESPDFEAWRFGHRRLEARNASTAALLRSLERPPTDSVQASFLTFLRGRTLLEAGREEEARGLLEPLAMASPGITDEMGNPFSLYAAEVLGPGHLVVPNVWLPPIAEFYLRDLDSLALAEEYALLHAVAPAAAGIDGWRRIGSDWMVGRHEDHLFGVRLENLSAWAPEREIGAAGGAAGTLFLAPTFPDLAMLPDAPERSASVLWGAALLLIVFLSAMAGVLLFRDQQREKRLAALRSRFVSSVSHEVRTPLSAIRLYTESLLNYGPGEDEAEWREDVGTIARETGRLTRMLDNVLTFSRVERGTQQYRLEEVRLDRILQRTARVMRPALEEVECTLELDLEAVEAALDADAIQQAVVNLLSNAARYAPGSRVTLSCGTRGEDAYLTVADDGPGLASEDAARVFEPFYRARKGADTGTGLGLSIVEHVAHGHGGRAAVQSAPGQGCQFTISFRIAI